MVSQPLGVRQQLRELLLSYFYVDPKSEYRSSGLCHLAANTSVLCLVWWLRTVILARARLAMGWEFQTLEKTEKMGGPVGGVCFVKNSNSEKDRHVKNFSSLSPPTGASTISPLSILEIILTLALHPQLLGN